MPKKPVLDSHGEPHGHWKFRAIEYGNRTADEIFNRFLKIIPRIGGKVWTDGVAFHITGRMQCYKEAQEILADYGAEWELTIVNE